MESPRSHGATNPDAFSDDLERKCLRDIENAESALTAVAESNWVPKAPIDLRIWTCVFQRLDEEIAELLDKRPDILATSRKTGFDLSDDEAKVSKALVFLKNLVLWDDDKSSRYHLGNQTLSLIHARSANVLVNVLLLLTIMDDPRPACLHHRLLSTRWATTHHRSATSGSTRRYEAYLKPVLTAMALALDEHRDISGKDTENLRDVDVVREFDEETSRDASFNYKERGSAVLMQVRAKRSRRLSTRLRVLVGRTLSRFSPVEGFNIQLSRDAALVLFNEYGQFPEEIFIAESILAKPPQRSSAQRSLGLVSRIPGRGILVESLRHHLNMATAEFETQIGMSFTRAANSTSSAFRWVNLEAELDLCTWYMRSATALSAMLDGGVVRSVSHWFRQTVADEDDSAWIDDNDEKCFALSAACVLWMDSLRHQDEPQEVTTTMELIKSCENMVVRLCEKRQPSYGEKTLLCALLQAIQICYSLSRGAQAQSMSANPDTDPKLVALRTLLVAVIDNSNKLGGGVVRNAGRCLIESIRGIQAESFLQSGGLKDALLDFINNLPERCPSRDLEAVVSVVRYFFVVLRKGGVLRGMATPGRDARGYPIDKLFELIRSPRMRQAFSYGWNDLGDNLAAFLRDAPDGVPRCVQDLKDALELVNRGSDAQAWEQTMMCAIALFEVRDFSRQFLATEAGRQTQSTDGVNILLSNVRPEEITLSQLTLLTSAMKILGSQARNEMTESFSRFATQMFEDPLVHRHGKKFTWFVWLGDVLRTFLSPAPARFNRRVDLSAPQNDFTFRALTALAKWDLICDYPTRIYSACLAELAQSYSERASRDSSRTRNWHETASLEHLVWAVESCIHTDPIRAMSRFVAVTRVSNQGGDLVKILFDNCSLSSLIKSSCEALMRPQTAQLGRLTLSRIFHEKSMDFSDWQDSTNNKRENAKVQLIKEFLTCATSDSMDWSLVHDDTLILLAGTTLGGVFNASLRLKSSAAAGSSTGSDATQQEAEAQKNAEAGSFKSDPSVVATLMDMGFHVSHVLDAQERLKTNEVGRVASYLLENPRSVTDEDELKLALWLSEQTGGGEETADSAEVPSGGGAEMATATKAEVVPELSPEEILENNRLDAEERATETLRERLWFSLVERLGTFGRNGYETVVVWDAVVAEPGSGFEITRTLNDLLTFGRFSFEVVVFVTNQTSESIRFSAPCPKGVPGSSVDVPPSCERFPVVTYGGAHLRVSRTGDDEKALGYVRVENIGNSSLTIPRDALTTHGHQPRKWLSPRYRFVQSRNTEQDVGAAPELTVMFVNQTREQCAIVSTTNPGEFFVLESGASRIVPCRPHDSFFAHAVLTNNEPRDYGQIVLPESTRSRSSTNQSNHFLWSIKQITGIPLVMESLVSQLMMKYALTESGRKAIVNVLEANPCLLHFAVGSQTKQAISSKPDDSQRHTKDILSLLDPGSLLPKLWNLMNTPHPAWATFVNSSDSPLPPSAPSFQRPFGKKRRAGDAELVDQEDQTKKADDAFMEVERVEASKKKKKSHVTDIQMRLEPLIGCCVPTRSFVMNLIALLKVTLAKSSTLFEESVRFFAKSLWDLNDLEAAAAITSLKGNTLDYLTLDEVIAFADKYEFHEFLTTCVEEMLLSEDEMAFMYRWMAFREFTKSAARQARRQVASGGSTVQTSPMVKIPLDSFISRFELSPDEHEKFTKAVLVNGGLILEGSDVVACGKPDLDHETAKDIYARLFKSLEPHVSSYFLPYLLNSLHETWPPFPRIHVFMPQSPSFFFALLDLVRDFSHKNFKSEKDLAYIEALGRMIAEAVRGCSTLVPECRATIAKSLIRSLETTNDLVWTCSILSSVLTVAPYILIECDKEGISAVALSRLARVTLGITAASDTTIKAPSSAILRLLAELASSKSREIVKNGLTQKAVHDLENNVIKGYQINAVDPQEFALSDTTDISLADLEITSSPSSTVTPPSIVYGFAMTYPSSHPFNQQFRNHNLGQIPFGRGSDSLAGFPTLVVDSEGTGNPFQSHRGFGEIQRISGPSGRGMPTFRTAMHGVQRIGRGTNWTEVVRGGRRPYQASSQIPGGPAFPSLRHQVIHVSGQSFSITSPVGPDGAMVLHPEALAALLRSGGNDAFTTLSGDIQAAPGGGEFEYRPALAPVRREMTSEERASLRNMMFRVSSSSPRTGDSQGAADSSGGTISGEPVNGEDQKTPE